MFKNGRGFTIVGLFVIMPLVGILVVGGMIKNADKFENAVNAAGKAGAAIGSMGPVPMPVIIWGSVAALVIITGLAIYSKFSRR